MKKKYDVFIITFTTTLIFLIWKFIVTLFTGTKNDIILWIIGFVSSVGVYRSIVFLFHSSLKAFEPIKKFFLGNEYLNGIWLGYYIDTKGEKKYIVEYYEQDIDTIQIRGYSYNENLELHASWTSTSIAIDVIKGKIFYTYSINGFADNINYIGYAEFDFERKKYCKYPLIMHGFSTEIQIAKRVISYEEKLTDKTIIKSRKELDFAQIASKTYKDFPAPSSPFPKKEIKLGYEGKRII